MDTTLAISPSREVALISSVKSAGTPVTPASTEGNSGRRLATARRMARTAARSAAKVRGASARSMTTYRRRLVVGEEVAVVRESGSGGRDEGHPGRAVGRPVEPLRHPAQKRAKQTGGSRIHLDLGGGSEDGRQEHRAHVLVDPVDQPVERRAGGEVGEQVLVGGGRVEEVSQRLERQVHESVLVEAAGVDPIADARRGRQGAAAENAGQAGRVGRGGRDGRALHDDDDVLELAEVLAVLLVERGVPLVRGEQVELGRLERQGMRRVAKAERGEETARDDRQPRAGAAEPDHALQDSAREGQHTQSRSRSSMAVTARTGVPLARPPGRRLAFDLSRAIRASYDSLRMTLLNCAR